MTKIMNRIRAKNKDMRYKIIDERLKKIEATLLHTKDIRVEPKKPVLEELEKLAAITEGYESVREVVITLNQFGIGDVWEGTFVLSIPKWLYSEIVYNLPVTTVCGAIIERKQREVWDTMTSYKKIRYIIERVAEDTEKD